MFKGCCVFNLVYYTQELGRLTATCTDASNTSMFGRSFFIKIVHWDADSQWRRQLELQEHPDLHVLPCAVLHEFDTARTLTAIVMPNCIDLAFLFEMASQSLFLQDGDSLEELIQCRVTYIHLMFGMLTSLIQVPLHS